MHNRNYFEKELSPQFPIFGHLIRRANSLEKTLMLGRVEGKIRRGQQRMRWLDGITNSMDMSLSKLWEIAKDGKPGMLQSVGSQRVRHDLVIEQQHQFPAYPPLLQLSFSSLYFFSDCILALVACTSHSKSDWRLEEWS